MRIKANEKNQIPRFPNEVDTIGQTFWFVVSEPGDSGRVYLWDLRGSFGVDGGQISIISIELRQHIRQRPKRVPRPRDNGPLNRDRIRQLTAQTPIKKRISDAIARDGKLMAERLTADPTSPVLNRYTDQLATQLVRPNVKLLDEDWARMAQAYLDLVATRGTAHKVQRDLGNPNFDGNWGVGHQAVRSRVKRLRTDGWIQGTGHLVQPGPTLKEWVDRKE